jgi:hypothetical protein
MFGKLLDDHDNFDDDPLRLVAPDPPCGGGGGGGGDKNYCHTQYDDDMGDCRKRYNFSSSAYSGCITRAATNREFCLKGLPEPPTWKDIDVDGVPLPKPPKRRR